MDTEVKNAINATGIDAQYDEKAKRLLSNKIILAHILVKTVGEFMGMEPEEAVQYIEGEPFTSKIPLEPGLVNVAERKNGQRIVGLNTENAEVNEGLVRFDIVFYVRMKDGVSQVIINLEIQKDEPAGYAILDRAVFYVSRLISSQKERDFTKMNYGDIKRVYSIWICMNMEESCMDYIHLIDDKLLGSYQWKGRMDLINIVFIGIPDKLPVNDGRYNLHRLLGTLLSMELTAGEKLGIIGKEYNIPLDDQIREDVSIMCNLSQGIFERGEARGEARGKAMAEAGFIKNMYEKGYNLGQIADVTGKSIEEIKVIIGKEERVLV